MYLIAICDDEKNICSRIEQLLIAHLEKEDIPYEIDVFSTGTELLNTMNAGRHYDLLFLDIELAHDDKSGVEFSHLIRENLQNKRLPICFISWEVSYAMSLFDSQPLNFLVKPVDAPKIEKVMRQFSQIAKTHNATLSYKIGHDYYKQPLQEILYLESQGRKINVYLNNGETISFYGKLKEVYAEGQLEKFDFLLVHASYVVNDEYVARFSYEELTLLNGKKIPISQVNRARIRNAHFKKQAREL